VQSLIAALLDEEIEYLIRTVEQTGAGENPLGTLIQAFHSHYAGRLNAFRLVYCQSQLLTGPGAKLDEDTLRKDINPRTRHLFDVLEGRMSPAGANQQERERQRQLAFSAWLSALGLMTMLGIADATNDPLIHSDERLLLTLKHVFDQAAATP
jgi:hypothetical protein